ncbi:MAG: 3-isopropylmalate dehydrogenase [Chloroflexi bacterium]|nr:3-isopropylmalate dehydrogenase [Chloroflexota bacterium]
MYRIGVIPGDGIGPEVVREGLRVLASIASIRGFTYELLSYPFGAQHYLETGELIPERVWPELRALDAILFGAGGDPRVPPGVIEVDLILALRYGLDAYVNLRPIRLYAEHLCPIKSKRPADVDFTFVRENTEDAYPIPGGFFKKGTEDEVAIGGLIYTRKGVERSARYSFALARRRRHRVTLVHQANAIKSHEIWTRVVAEVAAEFLDVELDYEHPDSAAMRMIQNPEHFDVVLTPNYIGGILTDLGAVLQGGLGMSASGSIHPGRTSMFEPVHGSAPKYAGRNVANPIATIGSIALLLDHVGEAEGARLLDEAIVRAAQQLPSARADSGWSTTQIGDLVITELEAGATHDPPS